jgi:hypothetical protein
MSDVRIGKGLDIGTVNLVASEMGQDGKIVLRPQRNCFIDIPAEDESTKNRLTQLKVPYVVQNKRMYVIGDVAFDLANVLNKALRRPMRDGLISPREIEAVPIMMLLIDNILGKPRVQDEPCYYTVPAEPIDSELNVVYHKEVFNVVLTRLGYRPMHIVEGQCVVLSELGEEEFTGIGISCGGGMHNVSVSYKSLPCLTFSTSRAGDWIDNNAARVLGVKPGKIAVIKERRGIDILKPQNREEEAISIYYRELAKYTLTNIKDRFERAENMPEFPDPVSIVLAGGTSMVKGYVELFRETVANMEFPLKVKEVRHAEDPFYSVAKGALFAALSGQG